MKILSEDVVSPEEQTTWDRADVLHPRPPLSRATPSAGCQGSPVDMVPRLAVAMLPYVAVTVAQCRFFLMSSGKV